MAIATVLLSRGRIFQQRHQASTRKISPSAIAWIDRTEYQGEVYTPNIIVKVPEGTFDGIRREARLWHNPRSNKVEKIGDDLRQKF